jgi:transposase
MKEGLDWIHHDLTRAENAGIWPKLHELEPTRARNELFDMVWWMYFRELEPVLSPSAAAPA